MVGCAGAGNVFTTVVVTGANVGRVAGVEKGVWVGAASAV